MIMHPDYKLVSIKKELLDVAWKPTRPAINLCR